MQILEFILEVQLLVFILRRLAALPLVMLAVTLLTVGMMQFLTPEERASAFITSENQVRNLDRVIKEKGLDQPFPVQYGSWIINVFQGNLGFSQASKKPVLDTIIERFPATLELALYSFIPIIGLGIWMGTLQALNKDKLLDQTMRVVGVIGYVLPTFVVGIVLLVIFYGILNILPGFGRLSTENEIYLLTGQVKHITGLLTVDALLSGQLGIFWDALKHMILPVVTLSAVSSAGTMKVMRANMLDIMKSDFVRTARAKGLTERVVNLKHARRNALMPIVTLASFLVQGLLAGAVITETIFAYPGIGSWGANAATTLDYAGILGFAVFIALLTVIFNLLADVAYGLVDPRVRFD